MCYENELHCIHPFKNYGMGVSTVTKALHRFPSTVSREINRNDTEFAKIDYKRKSKYYFVTLVKLKSKYSITLL